MLEGVNSLDPIHGSTDGKSHERSVCMQTLVRGVDVSLTPSLEAHVAAALARNLDHLDHRLVSLQVTLSAIAARHHRQSAFRCRMVARRPHADTVVVVQTDMDLYTAIDHAADSVRRAVQRRVSKRRTLAKKRGSARMRSAA